VLVLVTAAPKRPVRAKLARKYLHLRFLSTSPIRH
jgi:hypothetical protein